MDLADNDLMDLFLRRKEPEGALDTPEVGEVLRDGAQARLISTALNKGP